MARKYIYCIVDPRDNSYDYETDGWWTDDIGCLRLWQLLGIPKVVFLDALSMELCASYDNAELETYLDGIGENYNIW